jgi:hypothetical protein
MQCKIILNRHYQEAGGRMKILEAHDKPWCICRLGAKPGHRIIRRYVNRQDAEDDLKVLTRFVKDGGQYVIAFDVIEVE